MRECISGDDIPFGAVMAKLGVSEDVDVHLAVGVCGFGGLRVVAVDAIDHILDDVCLLYTSDAADE